MAKTKKAAKPKIKTNFFYGLNIKISSENKKGDELYLNIIDNVFSSDIKIEVGVDKKVTLRTQDKTELTFKTNKYKVVFGKIIRYTKIEGDNWYNEETKQTLKPTLPENSYPGWFDTDYIFIPSVHKFFVAISSKVTLPMVMGFLSKALPMVVPADQEISINLMQSHDKIEEIIRAPQVEYLNLVVSYTNDDVGSKAQESIDKILKKNYVGKLAAQIRPDQHKRLNTKEKFLRGLLELAKDNGEATAGIINKKGKKDKIVTSNFPEKIAIKHKETEDEKQKLFLEMMEKYKDERAANT